MNAQNKYVVWPHLASDDMTSAGPALCPVLTEGGFCEISCPDETTVCTYLSGNFKVFDSKEEAIKDWLADASVYMKKLQNYINMIQQ
jgi:hypothetical protein